MLADPVDLSIGVPEELSPEHVKAAGIRAIQQDHTTYTPANGLASLREALAVKLREQNHVPADAQSVTVVPGLTTGQLLVYMAILDPEDELIVFDPYFPPYPHLATMVGARVTYVSTQPTFQPDLKATEAAITSKTKAILINSPNNPSGAVYPEATLRALAGIAERHNLLVISDEIYEHFAFGHRHFSIGSVYANTITMNGFSKSYAMTGWRVGYISGPQDIIDAINELQQYTVMSSSSIAQHAALAALQHEPKHLYDTYRHKRDFVLEQLRKLDMDIHGAEGAYYVFFKAPNDMTDLEFVAKASEQGLILVPGRAFSQLHGYVRLSYGADMPTVKRGLHIMDKLVHASSRPTNR